MSPSKPPVAIIDGASASDMPDVPSSALDAGDHATLRGAEAFRNGLVVELDAGRSLESAGEVEQAGAAADRLDAGRELVTE